MFNDKNRLKFRFRRPTLVEGRFSGEREGSDYFGFSEDVSGVLTPTVPRAKSETSSILRNVQCLIYDVRILGGRKRFVNRIQPATK